MDTRDGTQMSPEDRTQQSSNPPEKQKQPSSMFLEDGPDVDLVDKMLEELKSRPETETSKR